MKKAGPRVSSLMAMAAISRTGRTIGRATTERARSIIRLTGRYAEWSRGMLIAPSWSWAGVVYPVALQAQFDRKYAGRRDDFGTIDPTHAEGSGGFHGRDTRGMARGGRPA